MNYTYEFINVSPKQLFVQVKYSADGMPDQFRNIITKDFSEENLQKVAKSKAQSVISNWEEISNAPEQVELQSTTVTTTYKPTITLAQPAYDPFTQIPKEVVSETETEIVIGWSIVDLSEEEKQAILDEWRFVTVVTPRQARLELSKRGQIANIDTIIASLPADQQEIVQIEWEYAVSIERNSPWVIQLGSALGLDEAGLDELFKAASVL